MKEKNNYILGLDLGITSVGFGIIEKDTYKVVDFGVRLFDESTADNNLTRRTLRGGRRLKSRKTNRINAIKHLLVNNNIVGENYLTNDYPKFNNIYELRVKGLNNKLTNDEFANVLINIAKKRGSSLDVAVDDTDKEALASASSLTKNSKELLKNDQFVCEHQLAKLNECGKIRNSDNIYKTEDYVKEVKQILSNQGLSDELNEKIVEIISRRRNFSEGPGSEKFPTPYGSYRYVYKDGEQVLEHVNLIEVMKGKCSIFPNEPRIAKNTFTACLFNLLNDLNNLKINRNTTITKEQKIEIIEKYIKAKGTITVAQLCKFLNVDKENITGFRIDKSNNPLLSTFDTYKKLKGILPDRITLNIDLIDKIIEILTKTLVVEQRKEEISQLLSENNESISSEELDKLCNLTKINGYHSLSKKAMDLIIPELIETNKNQMQIITDNKLGGNEEISKSNKIQFNDELILSPVTKRVYREALKVLNELRKEYGEFDSIVIETTRAKNSQDEKNQEKEKQKNFEKQKKEVEKILKDKDPSKYSNQTKLKVRLYQEQEGKTIYAGLPIDLDTLLNDETAYQIEHIIPYAVSFDNSYNNKALASAKENQDKGKMSPWGYFSSGKVVECNGSITCWSEFESIISSNTKISKNKNKKLNLLNQEDISKFSNMQEFVARNLNDTSYAIKSIMTTIKDYYKANEIDTKVFTVKGKFTSDFRNKVGLKKNRDFYIHHAIDALIIAGSKNQKMFNKAYQFEIDEDFATNKDTGEVIDLNNSPLDDKQFLDFVRTLKDIKCLPEYFSYKVDRKTNRQFADQTIYSTRKYEGEDYIVGKYKNIYGPEGESLAKRFKEGKIESLLVFKNDKETFNILNDIYEFYKNEKNPFAKYKEEHGPIKKYSKKGNGPEIYQIKYIDKQLGNCIDISTNYSLENSNKKVVLDSVKPFRIDIYKSIKGIYKMVTVFRYNVRQKNDLNYIYDYDSLKMRKNIELSDKFVFSLNRNDIVRIVKKDEDFIGMFTGLKNELKDNLEFKKVEQNSEKRITYSINKNIINFEKYNVSPTGKWSKVTNEVLKLKWK